MYDLETGERETTCNGLLPVIRPPGVPMPCRECPKGSPEREHEFVLTPANRRTWELFKECRATGGRALREEWAADRWLASNFAVLDRITGEAERQRLAMRLGIETAKVLSRAFSK